MLSKEMDELIKQRQGQVKKENSQIPYGVALLLITLIMCAILWKSKYNYAVCLGVGVIIGIILRYSRFCFTAAFRDPFISGNTRGLRGMILAMIVSTVGFAVIQSGYIHNKGINYNLIPGAVSSVGIHVMIGAFIFGIGMVLAGGCASGVVMRIGEGHALHWNIANSMKVELYFSIHINSTPKKGYKKAIGSEWWIYPNNENKISGLCRKRGS